MKKVRSLVMMMFLLFLFIPVVNADTLDLSTFTAEDGVTVTGDTVSGYEVTFTESDDTSGFGYFYFYDPAFFVDSTATSITFDYSLDIGPDNDDWLVVAIDFINYEFQDGGDNPSTTDILTLSGTGMVDLTSYRNSTVDLAFGFEANDFWMDSVGTFWNIQINHTASPTPEPTTIALLGLGLLGMAGVGRKMS